jgi:cytosine/uracil/thiamine/allantoin permease
VHAVAVRAVIATLSTNIAANVVSPANALINADPAAL